MSHLQTAISVVRRLQQAGFTTYFAGGWVRDYLMRAPSDDIDIATSASVAQVQRLFPKTVGVGVAFGIVIVVQEGHQFEVATFRQDRGYVDGRRPTGIDPATPEEDAQRRDFTMNGMFYDPIQDRLYDYVGGADDIERRLIRTIGDPHARFAEDRLRMMRAVRYSTRFNFSIAESTSEAILSHAEKLLTAVAMERIWQEFKKMSQFAHFDTGLVMLHKLRLLPTIFPQLRGISMEEIERRVHPISRFSRLVPTIGELLLLFPSASLQELLELCDYLKLSCPDKAFAQFYHRATHLLSLPIQWKERVKPIEWARFYSHKYSMIVLEIIAAQLTVSESDRFLQEHAAYRHLLEQPILRIQTAQPLVRAHHLAAEGIAPGKKMGVLLRAAEEISVNQGIEDRQVIIAMLKQTPLWEGG